MAKRAPTNQKPFTALDKGLAASVREAKRERAEPEKEAEREWVRLTW